MNLIENWRRGIRHRIENSVEGFCWKGNKKKWKKSLSKSVEIILLRVNILFPYTDGKGLAKSEQLIL